MDKATVGIIGGSGLYEIEGVEILEEIRMDTPWGTPSDAITIALIGGIKTAFLPRHGRGHFILPSEVNSKANIAALKMLGVREIIAFSAVGSLKEEIRPRDFIIPSQIIDRTKDRPGSSFFGAGVVAHVSFADPFCGRLCKIVGPFIAARGLRLHTDETLVCMEGPAFSTRAESRLYRSWGAGIINMSVLPEAKLAREAEICYAMVCMATDYDCWKTDHADVTVEMVVGNLNANSANAKALIREIVPALGKGENCSCQNAMRYAVMTAPEKRNPATWTKIRTILPELE